MSHTPILVAALALSVSAASNAQYLMMPDSTNNRIVLFDPNTGALVNNNYFALPGGTPIHAMQVGNEIWVSEQVGDRVVRFDLMGNQVGVIGGGAGGGMDNIRGMGLVGNTVYVTNGGAGNGSPGSSSVIMLTTGGASAGSFLTTGLAPSPFGILDHQGGLLVSSSSANDDIHRFSYAGAAGGTFHNSTAFNFGEQMAHALNGDVLAAGFSTNNIARFDPTSGALLSSFTASGARGVWQLGNGNIMWTSGSGAFVFDVNTGGSSQVYTGGGRYIDFLQVPAPGALACALVAGAFGAIRRRR